jgi:hypothetical protein
MPKIHVVYDPNDKIITSPEAEQMFGHKVAVLSIPEDLSSVDIYNLARRVAELLLEQLR